VKKLMIALLITNIDLTISGIDYTNKNDFLIYVCRWYFVIPDKSRNFIAIWKESSRTQLTNTSTKIIKFIYNDLLYNANQINIFIVYIYMWLPQTCPYNTATKGNIKALNVTYKYNAVDNWYIYICIYKFKIICQIIQNTI